MRGWRKASRRTTSSPRGWSTASPSARGRCVPTRRRPSTQARAVRTRRRAFSANDSSQFLNRDVLVPGLDLAAAVDLETNQSVPWNLRVGFRVVDRLAAIDRETDTRPLGADAVVVPGPRSQKLVDPFWRRRHQRLVAA